MKTQSRLDAKQKNDRATGSAGAAATVTIAAIVGEYHVIDAVHWSYSAAPTGGKLTITFGSDVLFEVDVTAAGPGDFYFPDGGLHKSALTANEAVTVVLAAPGGAVVGKVNVLYR